MKSIQSLILVFGAVMLLSVSVAHASKGRLNKEGCHTDGKTKKYHCHLGDGKIVEKKKPKN